jgi:hypothetical protein
MEQEQKSNKNTNHKENQIFNVVIGKRSVTLYQFFIFLYNIFYLLRTNDFVNNE